MNDLISQIERGEVIAAAYPDRDHTTPEKNKLTAELIRLAKLGQQRDWIQVTERLPEIGKEVDIWVSNGYGAPGRVENATLCIDDDEKWFEWGELTFEIGTEVSHWMLVSAPKSRMEESPWIVVSPETMPLNKQHVVTSHHFWMQPVAAIFVDGQFYDNWAEKHTVAPSHWMPLPALPEQENDKHE